MRIAAFLSTLLVSVSLVAAARADDATPSDAWQVHPSIATSGADAGSSHGDARTETHWYGWQNLTVDAASLVMFAGAARSSSSELAWMGLGTYLAGSAVVHAAHDRFGIGLASVLIRGVLPLAGGAIGQATSSCSNGPENEGSCSFGAIVTGAVVGALVAIVIDDAAFAREEIAPANDGPRFFPTAAVAQSSNGRVVTPIFGLAGVF